MAVFVQLGEWFGFDGAYWSPLIYQYAVGLILMCVGLWAGSKNGVWPSGRRIWLFPIIGGWFVFMLGQGVFHKQGEPQNSSVRLAPCPSSSSETDVQTGDVCVELGYLDTSRQDVTLDHRTQYDDVSGDPNDLFTVEVAKDAKENPIAVTVIPTGKGTGTAALQVRFSHSQLTAETQIQIINNGAFIIASPTEGRVQSNEANGASDDGKTDGET